MNVFAYKPRSNHTCLVLELNANSMFEFRALNIPLRLRLDHDGAIMFEWSGSGSQ
jgi:hypothetical protein